MLWFHHPLNKKPRVSYHWKGIRDENSSSHPLFLLIPPITMIKVKFIQFIFIFYTNILFSSSLPRFNKGTSLLSRSSASSASLIITLPSSKINIYRTSWYSIYHVINIRMNSPKTYYIVINIQPGGGLLDESATPSVTAYIVLFAWSFIFYVENVIKHWCIINQPACLYLWINSTNGSGFLRYSFP